LLNATIEAARAGDSGKSSGCCRGSQELARQTADAKTSAASYRDCVGEVVTSIEESTCHQNVSELARTMALSVDQQSITTREMAQTVARSSTSAEAVAQSADESASFSRSILQSIADVDAAASRTAQGVNVTQKASENLNGVVEELQLLIAQFKT
jgi:methyl-accepting chemotaxis protein